LLAGDQTRLCCHNSTPPLTAFACQGLSAARRQRIDSAVEAAGQRPASPYEAWIAADPSPGGVRVLITGPRGFERKGAFAVGRSAGPERIVRSAARRRRICRAEEALGGCPESQGGGDADACEGRQEEAPPEPGGAGADRCGDEAAVGGGEEAQTGEDGGGQTGPETRCPDNRGQESDADGRAVEGGYPDEGRAEAAVKECYLRFLLIDRALPPAVM
jgi:hypothetical protein